jgi:hypothetical protein
LSALKQIVTDTTPAQLEIHLDPGLTNLDGARATQAWNTAEPALKTTAIGASEHQDSLRHVHAKAIIGEEENGSWCVSGSANLSQSALLSSWRSGGNLELVTFNWSRNPKEFNYLLTDEMVRIWTIDLSNIVASEKEPSERETQVQAEIFLTDLTVQGQKIEGRISRPLPFEIQDVRLHLQRKNRDVPVTFQDETTFSGSSDAPIVEAEFARLEAENFLTPYRWIDQPSVLARYGARTYHVQIKGKIETLIGAEKLFQELMNFLWERVEPESVKDESEIHLKRKSRHRNEDDDENAANNTPAPGPEAFITEEELVRSLQLRIDLHHPYDRSLASLQDLLSLVLLRLTTVTQPASIEDQDGRNEDEEQKKQAEQEKLQNNIIERLRNYLISYCGRYANRLTDQEFIRKIPPEVIFQNQYTLGRVLLEFASKASTNFTADDLFKCFWMIWAPLAWPEVIRRTGTPALKTLLQEFQVDRVQASWREANMPSLVTVMFDEVLGAPPSWRAGLWDKNKVNNFVVANEWIMRIKKLIGETAFTAGAQDFSDIFGSMSVQDLVSGVKISASQLDYLQRNFASIERYLPPVEEKFSLLIELSKQDKEKIKDIDRIRELGDQICAQGLEKELALYRSNPRPIMRANKDEGILYCPRCGAELTTVAENTILKGNLALCPSMTDAWVYWVSEAPNTII